MGACAARCSLSSARGRVGRERQREQHLVPCGALAIAQDAVVPRRRLDGQARSFGPADERAYVLPLFASRQDRRGQSAVRLQPCGADPATRGFSGRGGRFRWPSTHCAHRDVMRACQGRTLLGVRRASGLGSRAPRRDWARGHRVDTLTASRSAGGHVAKMIVSITDRAASYQSLPSP